MGRRRTAPRQGRQRMQPSDQARAAMVTDYPEAVKAALRMIIRGGKAGKQVCIACHRKGLYIEVWVPAGALAPVAEAGAKPRVYWTCQVHHEGLSDVETARLLGQRR